MSKKSIFKILFILVLGISVVPVTAQAIVKKYSIDAVDTAQLLALRKEFGLHKTIPKLYESQILLALSHYPELKEVEIDFRLKETVTPLASRPSVGGLFISASKRKYIVTISTKTIEYLTPILLEKLSFNAQVGVLGHEIAHIAQYITMGFGKVIHLISIEVFSKNQVDVFERNTDIRCINHGLGYQLLSWSTEVRQVLKMTNWPGAQKIKPIVERKRYLNEDEIKAFISNSPLYK